MQKTTKPILTIENATLESDDEELYCIIRLDGKRFSGWLLHVEN